MIVKASPITRLQFQFTQIPVHTDGVPTALTVIPTATSAALHRPHVHSPPPTHAMVSATQRQCSCACWRQLGDGQ